MSECLMFGLDLESRCLAPVPGVAEDDAIQFLIGTHNIKMDNQICRLTVEGDNSRISSLSFTHPSGEVRSIAPSSHDPSLIATSSADYRNSDPSFGVYLWRIDDDKRSLEAVANCTFDRLLHSLQWEPTTNKLAAISNNTVGLYDVTSSDVQYSNKLSFDDWEMELHAGCWSPHSASLLALAEGSSLRCWDTRTNTGSTHIKETHAHRCLFADFNPNLQNVIATCGDDGAIRLWDLRKAVSPIFSLRPHAHWVWQVRFHPVHDQLLLSAGSDASVVLSAAQSVSSEALDEDEEEREKGKEQREDDEEEEEEGRKGLEDGHVDRVDEHEDSVYACVWSPADPWAFASLSFDGRLVVSRVSRTHKYALMQL